MLILTPMTTLTATTTPVLTVTPTTTLTPIPTPSFPSTVTVCACSTCQQSAIAQVEICFAFLVCLVFTYAIITGSDSSRWTLNIYSDAGCTNHLKTVSTSCGICYNNNEYDTQVLCGGSSSCLLIGSATSISSWLDIIY